MTFEEKVPAPAATEARTHTQTRELPGTREGVRVPMGPLAHPSTSSTHVDAFAGSFRSRSARRILASALYLAAAGCLMFAVGDLDASHLRAGLAIVAAAALWVCGEWAER